MEIDLEQEIIKTFGLERMSKDAQFAAVADLESAVMQRIGIRLTGILSDEDKEQFVNKVKSDHEDEAFKFLGTKVNNFQQIVKEEIDGLKKLQDDMFGGMKW